VTSGPPEIPLAGGTQNTVVRVGETVRRTAGSWTPGVHDLLRHVRDRGFRWAPEPLGYDDSGREVLSYIPGDTVGWTLPWPEWIRSDSMLEQVGRATAAYHLAVADFRPPGLPEDQIICHHDLAPYNMVCAAGELTGIIDWDLAGPGTPLSDLAFVAWQWVPFHGPFVAQLMGWAEPLDRAARTRRLLDAYGLDERDGFMAAVAERVRYNRTVMLTRAAEGDPAYQALVDQGHVAGMDEALGFLEAESASIQVIL
jgi:hypothetical protein